MLRAPHRDDAAGDPKSTTPSSRRATPLAAALLSAALVLTACGSGSENPGDAAAAGEMRSFEADNGTIEIPAEPQRIVAVAGAVERTLLLGAEPVGVSTPLQEKTMLDRLSPEQTAAYEAAANIGSSELDFEKIASLAPDLIMVNVPRYAWQKYDEERLASIAPTVFIAIDIANWKSAEERFADAIGELGELPEQREAYERMAASIHADHGEFISSHSTGVVNQWDGADEGTFVREYADSYCTIYAQDAGFQFAEAPASLDNSSTFESVSMERLTDLADFDVLLYPLDQDGTSKDAFEPILESNAWKALPQVAEGNTAGVACTNNISYTDGIDNLTSLAEALDALTANE